MYRPQADTRLLLRAYEDQGLARGARHVLDVGTGTGAVALAAAGNGGGACRVTAVDVSRRAVWAARLNSLRGRHGVVVRRGNLLEPVDGDLFDVILANPPYVPSVDARPPRRGRTRSWDAGRDGRALLDRLCQGAPQLLRPNGSLLVVQSSLCGVAETFRVMYAAGLHRPRVVARAHEPFGPVLSARARYLEGRGLIEPGCRDEELVVFRGDMA